MALDERDASNDGAFELGSRRLATTTGVARADSRADARKLAAGSR
jgi:hypothetical protein